MNPDAKPGARTGVKTGVAFGHPGLPPRWTTGAKEGVGTACSGDSRVWFTLANGIVTEVYYPRVDVANTRDLQFLVTDGRTFFHEEQRDTLHSVTYVDPRALAYHLTNQDPEGRYRITKRVFTDPQANALVIRARFESLKGSHADYHLYVLLAPHIGNQGTHNCGRVMAGEGKTWLVASREGIALAMGASVPFVRASSGFVGASDGWTDLHDNFQMDWIFGSASDGTIALTAEVDLHQGTEFTLVLGFGQDQQAAIATAQATLEKPWREVEQEYVRQWRAYCAALEDLSVYSADGGKTFWTSAMVLKAHEDKTSPGAFIASLSIPWGDAAGDANAGGYHLCWPRDLVHVATALLAAGDGAAARRALDYLDRTQNKGDGSWPQNCWVDGRPYWGGLQLDEVAMPVLLAWRLVKAGILEGHQHYPMVRAAALCLARCGPVTPQERWEENAGYSPATLAAEIAALVCAAELAALEQEPALARYMREVADSWATRVEDWTFTRCGALLPGHPEHYERIAIVRPEELDQAGTECRVLLPIANLPDSAAASSQCCIVDGGFLELVRYGVRAPDDHHVVKSLAVYDVLLRVETPIGPAWHRYNHDGYGEKEDGTPFDGMGVGRAWPLLTGERGHYELAAGRDVTPYVQAIECFANQGRMIPEQVWDSADIPERGLRWGHGTGSATPLAWAHAEYLRLLRSRRDGQVFDRIPEMHDRYAVQRTHSDRVIWKFNHKVRAIRADQRLRIETDAPAFLHWTRDNWTTAQHDPLAEVAPGTGIYAIEFPPFAFTVGRALAFTFYWPEADRWEGRDFVVAVT
ncbi:MAG: glucan 1,4-alpha-glucosidase [Chloroflexi bacterium]|nr:glucan 1,4-alpha-glucosidase [Chloroflexota bacterium]